jgi:hypothetical protein
LRLAAFSALAAFSSAVGGFLAGFVLIVASAEVPGWTISLSSLSFFFFAAFSALSVFFSSAVFGVLKAFGFFSFATFSFGFSASTCEAIPSFDAPREDPADVPGLAAAAESYEHFYLFISIKNSVKRLNYSN